jgi:protease-4
MKQFFAALAANLVTIAIVVVGVFLLAIGIAATAGKSRMPSVRDGSVLVVDLENPLSDAPADFEARSALQGLLSGGSGGKLPLRSAIVAIKAAATDAKISSMFIRGNVAADGYASGFAALKELREAILDFRARSNKPVLAYLVNAETKDYYVASAASVVTLDPFGALTVPGLASEEMFLSGFLEKYGIGVQVSRVGKYKSAVEPFLRPNMSPENRQQVQGYLGDLWGEVKRGIAASRHVDTLTFQQTVDRDGILQPQTALAAKLIDRVAYFDVVLADLKALSKGEGTKALPTATDSAKVVRDTSAKNVGKKPASMPASVAALIPSLPQISLADYATVANSRVKVVGARQSVAIVYAEGDIVDGQGGADVIGGDAMAQELRRIRADDDIAAVVLRVNSPGGSAVASETIQRELALMKAQKPVVVSMGTVAASGGYWITTAASRVFAEPNTITGSIGVFSLIPNVKTLANRNGITFDTVKTGKYADLYSIMRPRTPDEMAVLQRSVDAIYNAFIDRVATARHLSTDSVRVIAEGRVWSGEDAMKIGLVDSIGNLDAAVKSAASLARIIGDYNVIELPRRKGAAEVLSEMFDRHPAPVTRLSTELGGALAGRDPVHVMARSIVHELDALLLYNDPRNAYARMPYVLHIH